MMQREENQIPVKLDVEYKKIYARNFENAQLKQINNSEAYLFFQPEDSTKDQPATNMDLQREDAIRNKGDKKEILHLKDKISIVLAVGQRKRTLQASVISKDPYGVKVKFHFYNKRDYQIVDDLIYFVEKSKEERRKRLDFIFDQAF